MINPARWLADEVSNTLTAGQHRLLSSCQRLNSGYIMKRKLSALSHKYVLALKKHLNQSPGVSLQPALKLGRQAIAMGLETLDVAKIHEKALRISGVHCKKILEGSHCLQKHLQNLTHKILSAHEEGRKRISHNLQDEIAQTLLGIHVRLLTLKSKAAVNSSGFKQEIACTQQMVKESVQSITRFARKLNIHQKT